MTSISSTEDWFVETAAEWVLPYIGDLVGWRPVRASDLPASMRRVSSMVGSYSPRREIANTVAHRRRKGSFALLAQLGYDVAGWPAVAAELYRRLGWTQHLDHCHLHRGALVDVRDPAALARLGGPFSTSAHVVDVRRIGSAHATGIHNIPSVGVFAFRLQSFTVTRTPARQHEQAGNNCFSFSLLGNDAPLFVRPRREDAGAPGAPPELAFPVAIDRALFSAPPTSRRARKLGASPHIYGEGKSVAVYAPNWPAANAPQPIPADHVIAADLSGWRYRPPRNFVAIDPVLGRIMFPQGQRPQQVAVSYSYGFPAQIGGGEYVRRITEPENARYYYVHPAQSTGQLPAGHYRSIHAALDRWSTDSHKPDGPRVGVIELVESGAYPGPVRVKLQKGTTLYLRAANRTRPVIRLQDDEPDESDAIVVRGEAGSRLVIDGLLVTGRGLEVRGAGGNNEARPEPDLCDLTIVDSTFVPGWSLHGNCDPWQTTEPSIRFDQTSASLHIARSIVGAIHVYADEVRADPNIIDVADSILDATSLNDIAIASATGGAAFAVLTIARSTVLGRLFLHAIDFAENTIFASSVTTARRQRGCIRYSFVSSGSRTPRRHRCQPDVALDDVAKIKTLSDAERAAEIERVRLRLRPQFESMRYGSHVYGRLLPACADEIRRGADDESEMGVYHDLFEPQRESSLQSRLDECTPAGMQAGIIFVN